MNLFDVLFLDLYTSIRGDWNMDVDRRGRFLLKLLPVITLPDDYKAMLQQHFTKMIRAWEEHQIGPRDIWLSPGKVNPDYRGFDGRDWARNCSAIRPGAIGPPFRSEDVVDISYDGLKRLPWFEKAFYEEWSLNNVGSVAF